MPDKNWIFLFNCTLDLVSNREISPQPFRAKIWITYSQQSVREYYRTEPILCLDAIIISFLKKLSSLRAVFVEMNPCLCFMSTVRPDVRRSDPHTASIFKKAKLSKVDFPNCAGCWESGLV